jgi:hypothetical protein
MYSKLYTDRRKISSRLARIGYIRNKTKQQEEAISNELKQNQNQLVEIVSLLPDKVRVGDRSEFVYNIIDGYKVDTVYLSNPNFFNYILDITERHLTRDLRKIDEMLRHLEGVDSSGSL